MDVQKVIGTDAKGFAAQAKIHTRNNVGASGKVYVGSKQGYPEKGEKRDDYPGGYVLAYDPKTGKAENFGIAARPSGHHQRHARRGARRRLRLHLLRRPAHRPYPFHDPGPRQTRPIATSAIWNIPMPSSCWTNGAGRTTRSRGGLIARYDPTTDKLEKLTATVDDKPLPEALTKDGAILNWDATPDRKTLYAVEMSTNGLFSFDLTQPATRFPAGGSANLLPGAKATDCRAMCVGP